MSSQDPYESDRPHGQQPSDQPTPSGQEQTAPAADSPLLPPPSTAGGGGAPPEAGWGGSGGYGGQQPYGYGYGYAPQEPTTRTDDKAIWALVSAIGGFILCPVVLHIVGLVLANQSLRAIRSSQGRLTGDGIATTARVLSIVGLVLSAIGLVITAIVFAILIPLGVLTIGSISTSIDTETRTITPTSIQSIDGQSDEFGAGDITYELGGLDFAGETVDLRIQLGAGSLLVEVPDEVTVVLDAQVGAGQLDAFGDTIEGVGLTRDRTFDGDPDGGTLELDIEMGVGDVTLERVG